MKKSNAKNRRTDYAARVSKMACGESVEVPEYGKVTAYRCFRTGRRMFKLTDSNRNVRVPQGNLSAKRVVSEIRSLWA